MKKLIIAAAFMCAAVLPASAKNLAVPEKNPVATITVPNSWDIDEIDYGYVARSPNEDVFFSVEYATGKRVDKMLENNNAWLDENEIVAKSAPVEKDIELGGLKAKLISYDGTDEDGDTHVDFVLIAAGDNRLILLTLWASPEALKANKDDIIAIQNSVKAIN